MNGTITFPLSTWLGLAVGGVEIAGNGYVREPVTFVYTADGATAANAATVQWTVATGPWGTLDAVQVWDSAVGGVMLGSAPALVPVVAAQYDRVRVPAAGYAVVVVALRIGFGTGRFGWGPYTSRQGLNLAGAGVMLDRTFDTTQHTCAPGQWTQGPFRVAA